MPLTPCRGQAVGVTGFIMVGLPRGGTKSQNAFVDSAQPNYKSKCKFMLGKSRDSSGALGCIVPQRIFGKFIIHTRAVLSCAELSICTPAPRPGHLPATCCLHARPGIDMPRIFR